MGDLTESHYREIQRALNRLASNRQRIERAEQAGHDMSEYKTSYDLVQHQLEKHKAVYFPDKP